LQPIAYLLVVVGAVVPALALGDTSIVQQRQPNASIVIAERPTRMQQLAARELQAYIRKITGAELPIEAKPSATLPVTIYVGESEHTRRMGIDTRDLDFGAYRIKSGPSYLALVGRDDNYIMDKPGDAGGVYPGTRKDRDAAEKAWQEKHGQMWGSPFLGHYKDYNPELGAWSLDEHGSLNAVNDFLRWLGVRWYMPGDFGEICPFMPSITVPALDLTVRPEWSQREIHFHSANPYQISGIEMLWQLRLGLRPLREQVGTHGTDLLLETDWAKKNKPEFFAQYGGRRDTGKPCYSSEGLFESAMGFSDLMFTEYGKPITCLLPTDGFTALCQCDQCKGKDTPDRGFAGMLSDYVWQFMNQAAAKGAESHPDRYIMNFAYNTYRLPPTTIERFHPNLRVGICEGRQAFNSPEKKAEALALREAYLKMIPNGKLHFWEYYNTPDGHPSYYPQIIAQDLKWLKGRIHGSMIEFTRGKRITAADPGPDKKLAIAHLNLWLTTRLWWNPDTKEMWWTRGCDVNALLEEYYHNFYGPAAEEMKAFIEYCERHRGEMQTNPEPIDRAFEMVSKARLLAGDETLYARRVQLVIDSMEPMKLVREQLKVGREGNPVAAFVDFDRLPQFNLDGRLDEDFWSRLTAYPLRDAITGADASPETTFKLAWSGDGLYVAIRCEEPALDKLVTPAQADGDNTIFDGDSIEILLETPTHAYYQIAIDPNGHINDLDRPNSLIIGKTGRYETKWDAGIDVAAHKGEGYWSVEVKIPALGASQESILPFFGISGDKPTKQAPWHFNIGRVRKVDLPERQLSMFSPTGEASFHFMRKFATLEPKQ
jgi:hypothetical protein